MSDTFLLAFGAAALLTLVCLVLDVYLWLLRGPLVDTKHLYVGYVNHKIHKTAKRSIRARKGSHVCGRFLIVYHPRFAKYTNK